MKDFGSNKPKCKTTYFKYEDPSDNNNTKLIIKQALCYKQHKLIRINDKLYINKELYDISVDPKKYKFDVKNWKLRVAEHEFDLKDMLKNDEPQKDTKPTVKIIAFHGKAHSGKDTAFEVAQALIPNVKRYAFANKLKDHVREKYNLTYEQVYDPVLKESFLTEHNKTIRQILQDEGQYLRETEGDDVFTRPVFDAIAHDYQHNGIEVAIITDLRYENEAKLIKESNGKIVHVIRPNHEGTVHSNHASEQPLPSMYLDRTVINDASLDEYKHHISKLFFELV